MMIDVHTLVLNASYEALSVVPTQRAVVLLMQGRATSLVDRPETFSWARGSMPVPSVILLNEMVNVKRTRGVPLSRRALFNRDGNQCQYCGKTNVRLTVDHVHPRSRGGRNVWANVTTACQPCNAIKADRTPEEAGMTLHSKPYAPTRANMIAARGHEEWMAYL